MPLLAARQLQGPPANSGGPVAGQPGGENSGASQSPTQKTPPDGQLPAIIIEPPLTNEDDGKSHVATAQPPNTVDPPLVQNKDKNSAPLPSIPTAVDPGLAVRPTANNTSKAGGLGTSAIIGLSVSLVVVGLLVGLFTIVIVRRRRNRQLQGSTPPPRSSSTQYEDGKRTAGRTSPTGMLEAGSERFASRPVRSSSLVRGSTAAVTGSSASRITPRIIAEETHVEIMVDERTAAANVPLPASPPQPPTMVTGADAWGVPANRPTGWPAHLPHPMAQQAAALMTARSVPFKTQSPPSHQSRGLNNTSPSPISPAVEAIGAPMPMLAVLQQQQQQQQQPATTTEARDASLKRVHSVRSRGPSHTGVAVHARSVSHPPANRVPGSGVGDEEVWEESSMWSDSAVERFYPPRQSLTTFCNTASAAAAVAAAQAEAKRSSALQRLSTGTDQPDTLREAQRRSMAELAVAVAAMNDDDTRSLAGSMAFSEDDGTVAEELQRMLNAEYRARHPGRSLLPVVAERSPIITSADTDALPEPPAMYLASNAAASRASPMTEALGLAVAPGQDSNDLGGILNVSVERRHSHSPLPSNLPNIEMPLPQPMGVQDTAERLMAQSSANPPTVRDSIATTLSYTDSNDSRPHSQHVTTAQRVNLATATLDCVQMPSMPSLPQDIPLPPDHLPPQSHSPTLLQTAQPTELSLLEPQQIPLPVSRGPSSMAS